MKKKKDKWMMSVKDAPSEGEAADKFLPTPQNTHR